MPYSGGRRRVPSIGLQRDLRELAEPPERVAHVQEQAQAVRPDGAVVGQDEHVLEEPVEERAELGACFDRRVEVACVERRRDLRVEALERRGDLGLGVLDEERGLELRGCALFPLGEPARARVRRVDRAEPLVRERREGLCEPGRRRRGRAPERGARRARTRPAPRAGPRSAPRRTRRPRGPSARAGSRGCPRWRADRGRSRARRSPYGSREPVGRCPRPKETLSVSILSAAESTRPVSVVGRGASGRVGQVLLVDRGADGFRVAGEPGVLGADVALELRETPARAPTPGRPSRAAPPRAPPRRHRAPRRASPAARSCPRTSPRPGRT